MEFRCPKCSKSLKAPDESAGKRAKCPTCGQALKVPSKPPSDSSVVADSVGPAPEKGGQAKAGNWRPGEKVPKTGTYKCVMCGPGGGLMHALNLATGLAGIKPGGLAASQPTSTKFFREGELFTRCPNCAAIAADAGTTSDMTGWDFVSPEGIKGKEPTQLEAEAPKSDGMPDRGRCDICTKTLVESTARVFTTAELEQATRNGYCGKMDPRASAMGFDKKMAWQITLSMGAATNWALCRKCSAKVEQFLTEKAGGSQGDTPGTNWKPWARAGLGVAIVLLSATGYLILRFGNPQWHKYIYLFQANRRATETSDPDWAPKPPIGYTGVWRDWHPNGQLLGEQRYRDGLLDGQSEAWDFNGIKMSIFNYRDGRLEGKALAWYNCGRLMYSGSYKCDKKDGDWTFWSEDGTVTAKKNYTVGVDTTPVETSKAPTGKAPGPSGDRMP